jgi:hypothetical protein
MIVALGAKHRIDGTGDLNMDDGEWRTLVERG